MRKTSQCKRLENELKLRRSKGVDPIHAWDRLGIYRLSARVMNLRDQGIDIRTVEKNVYNRFGERVRVANYVLAEYLPEQLRA